MRKLVTVRTVSELRPIEGADLIELAIIDGWQCVVKKGEFKVGDQGLYFEIDSFVPAKDERFKFLEKNFTLWKMNYGARIKTIKLRGQVSQGLLLPLTSFPEIKPSTFIHEKCYAKELDVIKWEREGETEKPKQQTATWLAKKMKRFKHTKLKPVVLWLERTFPKLFLVDATRNFPSFIPKTDEERVQNLIGKPSFYEDQSYYRVTVKLDGSSMTVYNNRKKVGVCSRNLDLKKDVDNKFWATALKYNLDKSLKKLGRNIAVQGELMGPGIQGNREKLRDFDFFVYKIWDIDNKRYLGDNELLAVLGELDQLGSKLKEVPVIGYRTVDEFPSIDDFLAFAEGPSLTAPTREGVVFEKKDGTKGFKVIATSYLLKEDK
jgi:hypothetical protein